MHSPISKKHANPESLSGLPYQPENNDIPVKTPPTGFDALRTLAEPNVRLTHSLACGNLLA